MQLGNNRYESTLFNFRLQHVEIRLGTGPSSTAAYDLLRLEYGYGTTGNNGNLLSQTFTVPTVGSSTGFTAVQNYTYDSLNRIKDATELISPSGGSQTQSWKQTYTFDRYGNRRFDFTSNNTTFPASSCTEAICNPTISTSNNRLTSSGWTYDSSGNTTADAEGRTFTYDAENKQVKVKNSSNATLGEYFYDGDGKRVKKIVPDTGEVTVFVYDAAGKLVAEYSTVVESSEDAKVAYLTNDHLGSPRINTDRDGKVTSRHDYHPYGEEIVTAQRTSHEEYTPDSVRRQFTGYERDGESGLDFAQARMYNKRLGRYTTPDELFVDQYEGNPQSWNLYLFVRNNPLNLVDPFGSQADCPPGKICTLDEDGNVILVEDDTDPIVIEEKAPKCSAENPCRTELPDSWHDWVPAWDSFRKMSWNMRCRASGGCNVNNALYYFGKTSLELTPLGWSTRALKAAQAAPSVLNTLCFEEGTLILTEHGLKPIEKIERGDKVLSYNEKTKQVEYRVVLNTFVRVVEPGGLFSVKVEGERAPLGVTGEHPFYVNVQPAINELSGEDYGHGTWIEAKDLQISDAIRKPDGTWAKVEFISLRSDAAKVYNFEVEDNHNYFVGETNLLVHNNCAKVLQTAGNTIKKSTAEALGLSRDQVKKAVEAIKKANFLRNDAHHKIMSNGDYVDKQTGQVIGNIIEELK